MTNHAQFSLVVERRQVMNTVSIFLICVLLHELHLVLHELNNLLDK